MSSFIIDKRDYMRAAGLLAGIAEATKHRTYQLWIYDYTTHRNMTAADYQREFEKCYQMNALSVQEQYHDDDSAMDLNKYAVDFNEYKRKGRQAAMDDVQLEEWIYNLNTFFGSALYQTEKESYGFQMQYFFGRIITALVRLLDGDNDRMNFFGSFDR